MSLLTPTTITGGCLCGGVRYQIDFLKDHDWKRGPHTCQCTQCRKTCGSLVYNFHTVTTQELTWLSKTTYAEYNSSPGCFRAFCKNCGSSLGWTDNRVDIELAVGTFDEKFLLGERDTEDKPTGAYALALANPAGDHFHIRNQIEQVTTVVSTSGTKFLKGSKDGPLLHEAIGKPTSGAYALLLRWTRVRFHKARAVTPGFNATAQYVSNKGQYAFVAPDLSTDARGPCPGLNAMANHGYLPHNGVATIQQFIDGTYKVFGMGQDLGGFLAIYGALIDGDLTKWSIGGPSAAVPATLGLLGTPQGISGSHNKYEGDVSPARPDLYQYGNDYKVIIPQFQQMFDLQKDPATVNYDLSVLTPFRATRFQQSIDNNPYFFNGPFSGVLVQPAAYTFIYRFMGNKSAEHPEGVLNQEVLKSFYSITGESGDFTWTEGYEKIPDNWYKRAIGDEYTIPFFMSDVLAAAAQYPQFLDIGGNTGKTNTFTGVDLQDLTGGVFDGATLLQGNILECFAFQSLQQALPDVLKSLVLNLGGAMGPLNSAIGNILTPLTCPQLRKYDTTQFNQFPGAKGSP